MKSQAPSTEEELPDILYQLTSCLKKHVLEGLEADRDLVDDDLEQVKTQNLTLSITYTLGQFSGELDFDPASGPMRLS